MKPSLAWLAVVSSVFLVAAYLLGIFDPILPASAQQGRMNSTKSFSKTGSAISGPYPASPTRATGDSQ